MVGYKCKCMQVVGVDEFVMGTGPYAREHAPQKVNALALNERDVTVSGAFFCVYLEVRSELESSIIFCHCRLTCGSAFSVLCYLPVSNP